MRPARVERDDDAFARQIDADALHARDAHERLPQFSNALVAILPLGRDLDRFQDWVISVFGIVRVGGIHLSNLRAPN